MADAIRLLDSSGSRVLDSVSTEYEDSFCLESFGDLITYHAESEPKGEKAFIIARVQTWDPKQPDKAFYSYYDAFQLNKILFQTQVYLGKKLIHRLHVLNPLTNTDIIGNVQYFMVKGSPVEGAKSKATGIPIVEKSAPLKESPKLLVGPAKVESKRRSVQLPPPISTTRSGPPILNDPSMLISPTVREVEAGNTTWTRTGPVVVDISESEVGDMSRRKSSIAFLLRRVSQAVSPPKGGHVSAPGNAAAPITSNPEPNVEATSSHQKSMSGTLDREGTSAVRQKRLASITPKDVEMLSKTPTSPIKLKSNGTSPQSRAEAPAGQITRFCVPVSPNDITAMTPKTVKSRRRSLSYANTCNAGGAAASYDEWLTAMTAERRNGNIKEDYDASPFSQSNVFSPKSATIKEVDEDVKEEDEKEESPPASPFQGANVEEEMPIQTFDATLFATDNDFLESSRIRSIFKQNAVHTEDAVLFEMKEFTGVEVAESPVIIIVEDNPACEFCYPSPATLSRATPLMRTFHRTKCYIAAFLLILAMFFFIFFTLRDNSNKSSAPTSTNTKS